MSVLVITGRLARSAGSMSATAVPARRLRLPFGVGVPPDTDPIRVPASWRIMATMNMFDKNLLFEMSFALMRRFAFIEVPSPDAQAFR